MFQQFSAEITMARGDNWGMSRDVAAELGIETVLAEVLFEHQAFEATKLQRQQKALR